MLGFLISGSLETRARRRLRARNRLIRPSYWQTARGAASLAQGIVRASLKKGWNAAREIAAPAMCVQLLMLSLVLSYFYLPHIRGPLSELIRLKERMGLSFAFLSMGAIAVFAEALKCQSRKPSETGSSFLSNAGFGLLVFGLLGIGSDFFYKFQEKVWGGLPPSMEVFAKVFTDQFVWTVFIANPYQTLLYTWKSCGFRKEVYLEKITPFREFYVREMLAVLVTNWAFWIPVTALLYCLPLDLQFLIVQMAIVIWVMLLSTLTKTKN